MCSQEDITECPLEGCGGDPELNKRKNIAHNDSPITDVTIEKLKERANPDTNRFSSDNRDRAVLQEMQEGTMVRVVAWALTARPGNPESCNCGLDAPKDTDNHIVLVDPNMRRPVLNDRTEQHSVTAEFTPRVKRDRPRMSRQRLNKLIDPNWSGKGNPRGRLLVRVTGQLMFDSEHYFGTPLKRENDWEIHPVFKLEFCPEDVECRVDSDANWIDLDAE